MPLVPRRARHPILAVLCAACALGQETPRPVVYNDIGGDASVTLDRAIKGAYGARYTIVDMDRAKGYAGPRATAGELPSTAAGPAGEPLSGYVLAAYIVTAEGAVSDPVVLKATDKRLGAVALEAMRRWRFSPATLNGSAVASTAAQEFTFGPGARSESFRVEHIAVYQAPEVLLRRLPDSAAFGAYIERLRQVAGHFFAGSTEPESFSIVVLVHPGHGSRAWFVSSRRKGDDAELGRLRALLEAVEPVDVREGPAAFAIVASVAGGDPGSPPGDRQAPPPVPREWRDAVAEATAGVPYGSDAFLEAVWRSAR